MVLTTLEKISIFLVAVVLFHILKIIVSVVYEFAIGPLINKVDFKSKGQWALVTGSTDGIGKEYAKQLAAKGCDIVLVSRSMDKLKATAEEIEKEYNVATKIVQADFGNDNIYESIANAISGLEIGTLVNNVGASYPYPEYFLDVPDRDAQMKTIIYANMVSTTRMTAIVLPGMVERGKGVLINISSATADIPSGLLAVYGATKAYIRSLSDSLRLEYASKGIIVQCVKPGFVVSNMSKLRRDTLFAPTPKRFVHSALSLVGTTSETAGYFPHHVMFALIKWFNQNFTSFAEWMSMRTLLNNRSKYLKKYKKQ